MATFLLQIYLIDEQNGNSLTHGDFNMFRLDYDTLSSIPLAINSSANVRIMILQHNHGSLIFTGLRRFSAALSSLPISVEGIF